MHPPPAQGVQVLRGDAGVGRTDATAARVVVELRPAPRRDAGLTRGAAGLDLAAAGGGRRTARSATAAAGGQKQPARQECGARPAAAQRDLPWLPADASTPS